MCSWETTQYLQRLRQKMMKEYNEKRYKPSKEALIYYNNMLEIVKEWPAFYRCEFMVFYEVYTTDFSRFSPDTIF
jgi:hypothetical protein